MQVHINNIMSCVRQGKLADAAMTVPSKEAISVFPFVINQRSSLNEKDSIAVLLRNQVLWDVTMCPWLMFPDISKV